MGQNILSKSARKPGILLSWLLGAWVDVFEVVGVMDVELVRRNSHDGAYSL